MLLTVVAPAKILPLLCVLITLSAVVTVLVTNNALNVAFILRIRSSLRDFRPSIWILSGPPVQEGVFKPFVCGSFGPPVQDFRLAVCGVFRPSGWCYPRPIGQERWPANSSVANWTREEEAEEEDEGIKDDFDWEAVIDEATVEGESGSGEKFYDAEDEDQGSPEVQEEIPAAAPQCSAQQKEQIASGVDPSCPTGRIPEAELLKFQAEFERKRANRFHDDLEKAKAENARLLALLHQAQSKPHP
ncbi:hypothetical protein Dimus_002905 [Dionaea muscipula]